MRSADGRNTSRGRRATAERMSLAYSAEQRETLRRGLRILARVIARSHLRLQASRPVTAPSPPEAKDGA